MGPFLALGVKAGLRAIEVLGYEPFKMRAKVIALRKRAPYTCFADGVQFTTGCTLGKGNIEVCEGEGLKAIFTLGSRKLELEVRKNVLKNVESSVDLEAKARDIMRARLLDVFEERLSP